MVYREGQSLFYACPRYMLADDNNPDGHARGEAACTNRLSYSDAEKIVSKLSDMVQQSIADDEFIDFTGYSFSYKNINVSVLKYMEGDIRLGILNRYAIKA